MVHRVARPSRVSFGTDCGRDTFDYIKLWLTSPLRLCPDFTCSLLDVLLVLLENAIRKAHWHLLARLDEASGRYDVLGPSSILFHVKLTVHDVLVVHGQLKLEHLPLADERAVVEVAHRRELACARVGGETAAMGLLLSCDQLELIALVQPLVIEQRRERRVEKFLCQLSVISLLAISMRQNRQLPRIE